MVTGIILWIFFGCLSDAKTNYPVRTWRTLYMDSTEGCKEHIVNDDMAEGDLYRVMSDTWRGQGTDYVQSPAECTFGFNFGDRLAEVNVLEWWCNGLKDPLLAVYDNCQNQRVNLLARVNCTSSPLTTVQSSSSCIVIYHYRGHTRSGYFFSLEVVAREEVIAFPAGGIAAIIVSSIVAIMVVVKIFCLICGCDRRLPPVTFDTDEHKEILQEADSIAVNSGTELDEPGIHHYPHLSNIHHCSSLPRDQGSCSTTAADRSQHYERAKTLVVDSSGHTVVKKVPSGTGSHHSYASTSGGELSSGEVDYFDIPPGVPKLKRYPSGRITRGLWKH